MSRNYEAIRYGFFLSLYPTFSYVKIFLTALCAISSHNHTRISQLLLCLAVYDDLCSVTDPMTWKLLESLIFFIKLELFLFPNLTTGYGKACTNSSIHEEHVDICNVLRNVVPNHVSFA
jgi:hypothetical protein